MTGIPLIRPDWPAPPQVAAVATTRAGGVSRGVYTGLNLATHVGDDAGAVASNRASLMRELGLETAPAWLAQAHGNRVAEAGPAAGVPEADAAIATTPGTACVVMTADCLPVLFCTPDGGPVAAAHAGWRGLAGGVLEAVVEAFARRGFPAAGLLAWLGPAIGPAAYEVGNDVRASLPWAADAFRPNAAGRWQLDLYAVARARLAALGVSRIYGGGFCTHADERFFSHRRDGRCGRQATLVWLKSAASPPSF